MDIKIETPFGGSARITKPDREPSPGGDEPQHTFTVGDLRPRVRALLVLCIAIDGTIVLWLAAKNATLTQNAWDLLGTALLLAIGITCALAIGVIVKYRHSSVLTPLASQVFVICLAAYVWLLDLRSPASQIGGITGVALALGAVALCWVLYLSRYAAGALTRTGIAVVALFPLIGLVQFWIQNEYMTHSSLPLIDVQTELTPVGSTGPIIHVLAKTTYHNRGSFRVDVPATLTRVVVYPKGTPSEPPTPEIVAGHLNALGSQFGDYRETPAMSAQARLIYAGSSGGAGGAFLAPGSTNQGSTIIDIDSRTVRLAVIKVTLIAVTHRSVKETRTCYPPQVALGEDVIGFLRESTLVHDFLGGKALCTETQFASRGVIEELVSDHPVLRIFTMVYASGATTPILLPFFGTQESLDNPLSSTKASTIIENANPSGMFGSSAEYAPSDADVRPSP